MAAFRAYLVVVLGCLAAGTLVVAGNHGWNLLPIFFSNIAGMMFLAPYLLWASARAGGDAKALLPGTARACR